ncbi:hypothetical protein NKOR_06060 [Candidatus Nitrosopumilus koreensis AR1]|uniref:Uncharacterized protein n=2 Tax=Nitrosopumilus TaxID=338191 RepID=K0B807_9ARCH|nr:hypothetical protein NKOR_06060 [Candidatus Nitrosopumilus koreensis AR1]
MQKANNKIKSLKKTLRTAEKSARKKKAVYQKALKRATSTK